MGKIDIFNIRRIRKAVGAIIISPENEYLLVHKAKMSDVKEDNTDVDFWDFVKGGVKDKETTTDAVKREIYEETGIHNLVIKEEIAQKIRFEFPSNLKKTIGYDDQETTMYIVILNEKPVDLRCVDGEIDRYEFVNKDSVLDRLSHVETKKFWNRLLNEQKL